MIEFLNIIKVTPIISGSSNPAKEYEFIADTFSYVPQLSDNEAGNYWNCDKTIVIELPDSDVLHFFSIERKAILKIKTSDCKYHQIGTTEIPALVQISSNLTSANLVIKCKMLTNPL